MKCTEHNEGTNEYTFVRLLMKMIHTFLGMTLRRKLMSSIFISLSVLSMSSIKTSADVTTTNRPGALEPTRIVTINPPYGYHPTPVRVRLSRSEIDIIRRLQKLSVSWQSANPPPINLIRWKIEPVAQNSRTVALNIAAFDAARAFLSVPVNDSTKSIVIIIGRTQEYISQQVNALGCQPNLALYEGAYIMGATICNRSVIVINLTGYLFVRYVGQPITMQMEQKPEPPISATSYIIADRNLSGLAHEWIHVARNRLTDGFIPDNEPAWFREGLAEIVSGLSRVKASNGRMTYLHFHVIRMRKFSNWPNNCGSPLSTFRGNSERPGGCEYLRGAAAVELLIANYGGLTKVVRLYQHMRESGDFFTSFRHTYGMTIAQFENRADNYARYITQAEHYGK